MEQQQAYRPGTKEKILFLLIQLFFISILLQYNDVVTGFITGGLLLCCILYNRPKEKWQLLKERKHVLWMFLFFVWVFLSVITSTDIHEGFRFLDPRLPLLYFPVTIGLIRINRVLKEQVLLGIAIVTTVYCIACLAYGINNYIRTGNVDFLYNDALTMMTGQQSIYISLLVNFSIYIYARFIFFTRKKYKSLFALGMLFLFGMSYLLASRTMMLVLYLSVIGFIGYQVLNRKKYVEGIVLLVAVLVAGVAVYTFFPKTLNRFKDIVYTEFEYNRQATESHYSAETTADQWNGANFRVAAWKCGWELFKKNPLLGTGIGDKKQELIEKYKEKNFQFALQTKKNLHNNYLDILVSTGIAGLLIFLAGWYILPFRKALLASDYLTVLIFVTLTIAMITEVYFDRSLGGLLTGFFIPFLLCDK